MVISFKFLSKSDEFQVLKYSETLLVMMFISDIKDFVGNLAVITTVLQFLSGIIVCKQYVVNRSTAETSPLPFICGVLSAALWLLYGINKQDSKIILVNIVGITLMSSYTFVFYIFTFKKSSVIKQCFVMFVLLLSVLGYVSTEDNKEKLINNLGIFSSILTLLTVAAPMSKLFHVIKVKSTECLPFPMIVMSFFVSTLWFLYGRLEEDIYLSWVNFIGGALAASQLVLFVFYPRRPHSPLAKSILA